MASEQILYVPTKKHTFGEKLWYSFLAGLVFLLVANPVTFKMMRRVVQELFGNSWARLFADDRGCANVVGLITHSVVFMVVVLLVMLVVEAMKEEFGDYAYPV